MSNFIPIVSSSPPPIDDSGGFDNWGDDDDDDFGTFTGADDSSMSTPGKAGDWNSTTVGTETGSSSAFANWNQSGAADVQETNMSVADSSVCQFANFISEDAGVDSCTTEDTRLDNENRPKTIDLDRDKQIDSETITGQSETIKQSLTDSGLYSTEVSPVQYSDLSGSGDKSQSESDSIGDLHLDSASIKNSSDDTFLSNSEQLSCEDRMASSGNECVLTEENNDKDESKDSSTSLFVKNDNFQTNSRSSFTVCDNFDNEEGINADASMQQISEATGVNIPENIPHVSSHSFEGDIQVPVSSDTDTGHDTANNNATYIEDDNLKTDYEATIKGSNIAETEQFQLQKSKESTELHLEASDFDHIDQLPSINIETNAEKSLKCDLNISEATSDSGSDSDQLNRSSDSTEIDSKTKTNLNYSDLSSEGKTGMLKSGVKDDASEKMGSCNIDQESISFEQMSESFKGGSQKDADLKPTVVSIDSSGDFETIQRDINSDAALEELSNNCEKNSDDMEFTNFDVHESEHIVSEGDKFHGNFNECDKKVNEANKVDDDDFDDFSGFKSGDVSTEFEDIHDDNKLESNVVVDSQTDDFAAFSETGDSSFADFGSASVAKDTQNSEETNNWAAFSEPQISESVTASEVNDDDDDDWAAFGAEDSHSAFQEDNSTSASVKSVQPSFQNMTKQEKVLLAVTGCFSSVLSITDVELEDNDGSVLKTTSENSESDIWYNMRGLKTTNALTYHWSQSQWNNHLYHTLKVDTRNIMADECQHRYEEINGKIPRKSHNHEAQPSRGTKRRRAEKQIRSTQMPHMKPQTQTTKNFNRDCLAILFGHKKSSSMPIFASGLTMLEPTKGPISSNARSLETLIDTSKPDETQIYTQDTIPPAQFDWSSSGLTNPLEAANKTLNLDFLIQESEHTSGKSHALESEFLGLEYTTSQKPATIQPLENILANLKSSSTYKPTNQNEDLSQEASKVIQSLPNLSFMKTKVLMFPLKLNE